jgi:CheY-like chemotaxis protein/HPt (histidine-containing phosphotransfer) domain-containing protein
MTVETAVDGERALALLRETAARGERFALALVDMKMPRMNGLELVRAIKADQGLATLPIIMLTSLGREGEIAEARRAGVAAHLSKPVRQEELRSAIADALDPATVSGIGAAATVVPERLAGRVLLAEDNPVNQAVALGMLEALGLTVEIAENGRQAIDRVEAVRYDLVLMDCQMPELDGFAATAEIRRREKDSGEHLPIIALTANALDGDREICVAAGMDDYMSKPFTRARLASALMRWLPQDTGLPEGTMPDASQAAPPRTESSAVPDDGPLNPRALDAIRCLPGANGATLVNKVVHAYLDDTPIRLAQMQAAARAGDAEALRKAAHGMKSSSANVGAERLAVLCKELEAIGRRGTVDGAQHMLEDAAKELNRVVAALGAQVAEASENALT